MLEREGWYNTTVADGDTRQGAKQAFVQRLLFASFNPLGQPFPVDAQGNPNPFQFTDDSTTRFSDKSLGYRLALSWGEAKKNEPILTVGSDFNVLGQTLVENIRLNQTSGPALNPPGPLPLPPGIPAPPPFVQNQGLPRSTLVDPGLFVEAKLPFNDRLNVKAGGRIDWVHTSTGDRTIRGNIDLYGPPERPGVVLTPADFQLNPIVYSTDPTRTDLDRDFPLFAGFATSEYKLDEHWSTLSALGYAERAPTLTELYAAGPFVGVLQQGTSRLIGDPSLRKERLAQFDLGVKADYGWAKGGVTGFYAYVHDYITFDQNKGGQGITQVVFTNTDEATLAGGEMFGQFDLTAWLTPFGNLSYVQGTDRTHRDTRRPVGIASSRRDNPVTNERATDTEPLPQIPPLELRSGLRFHQVVTKEKPNARWQVEFSARAVTGQNNIAASLNELPTPGFTVFDVRSYWQVREYTEGSFGWMLTAGVENFGDKFYREHLDPVSGIIVGADPLWRPGTNFYFASQLTY